MKKQTLKLRILSQINYQQKYENNFKLILNPEDTFKDYLDYTCSSIANGANLILLCSAILNTLKKTAKERSGLQRGRIWLTKFSNSNRSYMFHLQNTGVQPHCNGNGFSICSGVLGLPNLCLATCGKVPIFLYNWTIFAISVTDSYCSLIFWLVLCLY